MPMVSACTDVFILAKVTGGDQMDSTICSCECTHIPYALAHGLIGWWAECVNELWFFGCPKAAGSGGNDAGWVGLQKALQAKPKNLSPIDDGGEDKAFLAKAGKLHSLNIPSPPL